VIEKIIFSILCLCSVCAFAGSQWEADAKTGCQVWNPASVPGETVTWKGACLNGRADGLGILQWYENAIAGLRYEGEMKDGKRDGNGVLNFTDGRKQDGTWKNDMFVGAEVKAAGADAGITWAKCPVGMTLEDGTCAGVAKELTYIDAMIAARESRIDGFTDWRLPTDQDLTPKDAKVMLEKSLFFATHCVVHPVITPTLGKIRTFNSNGFSNFWTTSGLSDSGRVLSVVEIRICVPPSSQFAKNLATTNITTVGDGKTFRSVWKRDSLGLVNGTGTATKNVFLVRGGGAGDVNQSQPIYFSGDVNKIALQEIRELERAMNARQEQQQLSDQLARQQADREQAENDARSAKNEVAFNKLLRTASPRQMYLGAIKYEDGGDRGRAKTVYRELLKRHASSQEALLASQRLMRLSDVEAVEASNSRAAYEVQNQNYKQCQNDRNACFGRCSGIKDYSAKSSCQNGCAICQQ
jgi:hypothetical protein